MTILFNKYFFISSIFFFNFFYYSILYNKLIIKNFQELHFFSALENYIGGMLTCIDFLILEIIFCFFSYKIKNKFLSSIISLIIPLIMILWFLYQVQYGQGLQGEADIHEFSPFYLKLLTSIYMNLPSIISLFLIRNIFSRKNSIYKGG